MVGEKAMEIGDFGKDSGDGESRDNVSYSDMSKSEKLALKSFFVGTTAGTIGFLYLALWYLVFSGVSDNSIMNIFGYFCGYITLIGGVFSLGGIILGAISLRRGAGINKDRAIMGVVGGSLYWLFLLIHLLIVIMLGAAYFG